MIKRPQIVHSHDIIVLTSSYNHKSLVTFTQDQSPHDRFCTSDKSQQCATCRRMNHETCATGKVAVPTAIQILWGARHFTKFI